MNQRGFAPIILIGLLGVLIMGLVGGWLIFSPYIRRPPITTEVVNPCDVDRDGDCDKADFALMTKLIGQCEEGNNFNSLADVDHDGCITVLDQQMLSTQLSSTPFRSPTSKEDQLQMGKDEQSEMMEDPHPACDLNRDGRVDEKDIAIFNTTIGKCLGDPAYNPEADFFRDECVDAADEQTCKSQLNR